MQGTENEKGKNIYLGAVNGYENKENGYVVDYVGLLGELDTALTMYSALEGFEEEDLVGTISSVKEEIEKLPQRHSDLWDMFKEVKNSYDEEAYELLLSDDDLREDYYERLALYSKTLSIALSSESFIMTEEDARLKMYKADLKKFHNLKSAVKLRYAESIDYRDFEPKIKKLLDTHIQANEVIKLNEPVNIFDEITFNMVKEEIGVYGEKSTAAKADAIAHATKRVITEKMEDDPAFYERFSHLIQKAIEDFRAKRLSDMEYLHSVMEIRTKVATRQHDDVPHILTGNEDAMAYYGVIKPIFEASGTQAEKVAADMALAIQTILDRHRKVHFWDDEDAQKQVVNDIDDFLYDEVKGNRGIEITPDDMDSIIERAMEVARHRSGR